MKKEELKKLINDYFRFNKTERQGFTALSVILVLAMLINLFIDKINFSKPTDFTEAKLLIAKLEAEKRETTAGKQLSLFAFDPNTVAPEVLDTLALPLSIKNNLVRYRDRGGKFRNKEDFRKLYGMTDSIYAAISPFIDLPVAGEPANAKSRKESVAEKTFFFFDPNKATADELKKLGFTEQQRKNLTAYRDKGGKFRQKEDLARIYGIDAQFFSELEPWISITSEETSQAEETEIAQAPRQIVEVEINSADSLALLTLPGIGPAFSGRIIKYRNLLGGFHSVEQLKEVYGMTDERFSDFAGHITIDENKLKKLRINFADANELSRHPYVTKEIAQKILKARSSHGFFENLTGADEKIGIEKELFEKIKPYLSCQ